MTAALTRWPRSSARCCDLLTYPSLGFINYWVVRQRYRALCAGVLLGLIWAGYHTTGFLISGYYTAGWIWWHAIYTVATRVLLAWIYNNSGQEPLLDGVVPLDLRHRRVPLAA